MKHYNYVSQNQYSGNNIIELEVAAKANSYKTGLWLTFLQARDMGLQITKGSHGVGICRGVAVDDEGNKGAWLGYTTVFNIEQTNCPDAQYMVDYLDFITPKQAITV